MILVRLSPPLSVDPVLGHRWWSGGPVRRPIFPGTSLVFNRSTYDVDDCSALLTDAIK